MLGNVWEWCLDWKGPYPGEQVTDYTGLTAGELRVNRGGGWSTAARTCRSPFRDANEPGFRYEALGFRVALAPAPAR